jgi:deoxyhypusine synthase
MTHVRQFIERHFRHFNAATVVDAARAFSSLVDSGGKMMITLAGAMSTAEIGVSLAEMIRRDKVHAITCTGANLEEDVFNLVAHDHYVRIPDWRHLRPEDEKKLELRGLNRVTDTCIPENEAFRAIEAQILDLWRTADERGERRFPHEFIYRLVTERLDPNLFQIDVADSWVVAAAKKELPLFVPGWEDSTLGNVFVSHVIARDLSGYSIVRSGTEYMGALADYYLQTTMGRSVDELASATGDAGSSVQARTVRPDEAAGRIGFFQIGGGIAGDFPICVVPMIHQDLALPCPYWSYFCQISDSTTSYGSYSGAVPTEKITWGKLDADTPSFMIESDASIVAPLIFAHVLGW